MTLTVKDLSPTGFAPLRIRIDLIDSQVAKDLFGRKAADGFFISKVSLFNNLKNANGEFGDSILVYSESLEVRVRVQEKPKSGGEWKSLTAADYAAAFGDPEPGNLPGSPPCSDRPQPNFVARYRPYTFDIVANTHDRREGKALAAAS